MPAVLPFVPLIATGVGAATSLISGNKAAKQNQQTQAAMQQTQANQIGLFNQANQVVPSMQGIANLTGLANTGFLADRAQLGQLANQYQPLNDQMQRLYESSTRPDGVNQQAIDRLMGNSGSVMTDTTPGAYQAQAYLAGNDAMQQLGNQLGERGILSSGTASRLGASTLSRLYADAAARGQQDRLSAYGLSNNAASAAAGLHQSNLSQQSGLLGNIANLTNQRQQLVGQQSGLLGNYLQGLQGQYGMQQGIANQYNQQAGLLGGVYQQQANQINPNPYGGFAATVGAFGNAAANFQQKTYY